MRFDPTGFLRLKPFDESDDKKISGEHYAASLSLAILIVSAALLSVLALALVIVGKTTLAIQIILVSTGLSAITAGIEWHKGLKARSLNQLTVAVLTLAVIVVSSSS